MISFNLGDGDYSILKFPYDEAAIKIVKSVPIHRWSSEAKTWTVETSWLQLLEKRFTDASYTVAIDGELWTPPDMKALSPPMSALFDALPAHLRQPAYQVLSKVLHPDVGGDQELVKQLNTAMEAKR